MGKGEKLPLDGALYHQTKQSTHQTQVSAEQSTTRPKTSVKNPELSNEKSTLNGAASPLSWPKHDGAQKPKEGAKQLQLRASRPEQTIDRMTDLTKRHD